VDKYSLQGQRLRKGLSCWPETYQRFHKALATLLPTAHCMKVEVSYATTGEQSRGEEHIARHWISIGARTAVPGGGEGRADGGSDWTRQRRNHLARDNSGVQPFSLSDETREGGVE
jgi:hypothetical protein